MHLIKRILRKIKRMMINVFGSKTDELYWRFRHIFDRSWTKAYLAGDSSISNSSKNFLIGKISEYFPLNSILEFGCASGLNLLYLAEKFPNAKIYGVDISKKAINEGRKYFQKKNIKNVYLDSGSLEALKNFSDKSVDLIFTNAVLIYFGKDKIEKAIKEFLRISKKAVILFEMYHNSGESAYNDNWIHDYKKLFGKFLSEEKIKISKFPENILSGDWEKFGHIIEITL